MRRKNIALIRVDKNFAKLLKKKAIDDDLTLIDWTKKMAKIEDPFSKKTKKINDLWDKII